MNSYQQQRVIGSCSVGSSIRTINADGTVVCETDDAGSIPSGMISMYNSTCPVGWTYLSAMENKMPRGSSTYGSTGGSDDAVVVSHLHSVNPPSTSTNSAGAHTHTYSSFFFESGGTSYQPESGAWSAFKSGSTNSAGAHTHTIDIPAFDSVSTGVSGANANIPAYVSVVFCLKD